MNATILPFRPKSQRLKVDNYFGGCPHCGQTNGCMNIGRDHWFVCHTHKTKWCIGSNLFSSWREQTEEDWRKNEYRLSTYMVVKPLPPDDEGGAA
jgi:hypothetical protein